MGDTKEQWMSPGETAQRLGVTTKALKVYEREGLVVPGRSAAGWRLYGPAEFERLHQIIVLRDLGVSLKAIGQLLRSRTPLGEILRLQLESLERQEIRLRRAVDLIKAAQRQISEGRELSLDDFANLTRETVVPQPAIEPELLDRYQALIAEGDPTGETSQFYNEHVAWLRSDDAQQGWAEGRALDHDIGRLKDIGDTNSEEAKRVARRWHSWTMRMKGRLNEAHAPVMARAWATAVGEAGREPFDLAPVMFMVEVIKGMKARGEWE